MQQGHWVVRAKEMTGATRSYERGLCFVATERARTELGGDGGWWLLVLCGWWLVLRGARCAIIHHRRRRQKEDERDVKVVGDAEIMIT